VARGHLAYQLSWLADALLANGRRSLLAEAEVSVLRAIELAESLPASIGEEAQGRALWSFLWTRARVSGARGGDAHEHWRAAEDAMRAWRERFGLRAEDATLYVETALGVARLRFFAGQEEAADDALAEVEAVMLEHWEAIARLPLHAAEAHRLRALLFARRGDFRGAVAAAERAYAEGIGWRGALAGAEAMRAAWRSAHASSVDSSEMATLRDRAIELHRTAIDELHELSAAMSGDLVVALPLAQARVGLADLLRDRGEATAARRLVDAALPVLSSLREEVHADCWDEALYSEATAMAAR
jgi:hypothetical protein